MKDLPQDPALGRLGDRLADLVLEPPALLVSLRGPQGGGVGNVEHKLHDPRDGPAHGLADELLEKRHADRVGPFLPKLAVCVVDLRGLGENPAALQARFRLDVFGDRIQIVREVGDRPVEGRFARVPDGEPGLHKVVVEDLGEDEVVLVPRGPARRSDQDVAGVQAGEFRRRLVRIPEVLFEIEGRRLRRRGRRRPVLGLDLGVVEPGRLELGVLTREPGADLVVAETGFF